MGNNNSVSDISTATGKNQNQTTQSNRNSAWQEGVKADTSECVKYAIRTTDTEHTSPESESLAIFDTLHHLPNELTNLKMLQELSEDVFRERQRIIKKLRDMADYLEKTHNDVLIADRVGTGVGIGSGLLVIGGLVAAPFTAGISLGLTVAGTTTGILSGITSAGANITGYFLSKKELTSLKKELGEHLLHLEKLSSSDSKYLVRATRFRPTFEMLGKLCEQKWMLLLTTFQKLITHALNGDYAQISRAVNHVVDPEIKCLIQKLPLPLNPESLHALAEICALLISQIRSIKQAIAAFLNYFKRPELAKLAMIYTGSAAAARVTTTTGATAADLVSAFKGTPMVMSKAARTAAGALTAVFIVIDVIHMVHICKETGATPTVQELRKMADDLEEEIKCTSNESGEKEEQLNKSNDIAEVNSQKMEETQELNDLEFFDCRESL